MKKLSTVCALSIPGMLSFSANAAGGKTGLYLNEKAGVSVLQLSGQSQNFSYADDHEKYNGGSSRDTACLYRPVVMYPGEHIRGLQSFCQGALICLNTQL